MSKLLLCSVYDSKVNAFAKPFIMRSRGEALRGWEEVVNDSSTEICKHATDFKLFVVGEFDEESGSLLPYTAPESLGLASEYKRDSAKAPTPSQMTGVGNGVRNLVDAASMQ